MESNGALWPPVVWVWRHCELPSQTSLQTRINQTSTAGPPASHHRGCCRKTARWRIFAPASNSNTVIEFTTWARCFVMCRSSISKYTSSAAQRSASPQSRTGRLNAPTDSASRCTAASRGLPSGEAQTDGMALTNPLALKAGTTDASSSTAIGSVAEFLDLDQPTRRRTESSTSRSVSVMKPGSLALAHTAASPCAHAFRTRTGYRHSIAHLRRIDRCRSRRRWSRPEEEPQHRQPVLVGSTLLAQIRCINVGNPA